jgi:membrane fusion protein (multidrug efflux system)
MVIWKIIRAALVTVVLPAVASASEAPHVILADAKPLDFPLTVQAPGTARANESVEIRPQVSESITAIRFVEGERVEAGKVLIELEDSEAKADVAAAKAALLESENQATRARELFKTKAVSASALDQRTAQRDADRAALDAAESRLAESKIRAPFAGRVGLRRVSLGSLVTPATIITTLDDTDTIKLDFDVPETVLSLLAEGLAVEAYSAAWPERRFEGEVETVDTRVDPVSRTLIVRARIPNPDALLRPGMFLSVVLRREDVAALMIPEQALVPEQSRQYVWVVGPADVVEKREVRTGRRRPGQVEIVAGLTAGERVVIEGTQKVQTGDTVQIDAVVDIATDTVP